MDDFLFDDVRFDSAEKYIFFMELQRDWNEKNLFEQFNSEI
jgi:hypothetical protein